MKKLVALLYLINCFAGSLHAQTDKTFSISASPISAILGSANLLFQAKLTNYLALTVPGNLGYLWMLPTLLDVAVKEKNTYNKAPIMAGGGLGARFLLANQGLNDTFYIEPRVTLDYFQFGLKNRLGDFSAKTLALSPMVYFGFDWYYDSGFYLNLGAGVGFKYFLKNESIVPTGKENEYAIQKLFPVARNFAFDYGVEFKIGYAW